MRGHNRKKDTHTLDFDVTLGLYDFYLTKVEMPSKKKIPDPEIY